VFEPSSRAGTSRASLDRQRPGFSPLVGAINQRLDNGWHVTFGAGYNFSNRFGVAGQFMYNGLGVSRGVLQEFSVPDGNANVWSITAEPRINFAPRRRFTPYFIGGVGYYRRTVEFTQPALAQTVVFDRFSASFLSPSRSIRFLVPSCATASAAVLALGSTPLSAAKADRSSSPKCASTIPMLVASRSEWFR
jgi:hypothetical protein